MPFLAGVKEAKFRTPVFPGDELEFEGKHGARGLGLRRRRVQGAATEARSVCEAQITYRVMPFPSPEFRKALDGVGGAHRHAESRSSPSDGAPRGVDHRRRSDHLPRRRARRRLGSSRARRSAALRRQELRALHRASARSGEFRQADSEEERSAADGDVAAHRRLRRRPRARRCRHCRQARTARRHRHDRRRRRRRARHCRPTAPSSPACARWPSAAPSSTNG